MKLHVGELYWPDVTEQRSFTSDRIKNDISTDVLIVGGGISGALSAYELAKEGHKVVLVEKNTVASGSSAANTGLIQYMSDIFLVDLIDQIGEKDAVHFYKESVEATKHLVELNKSIPQMDTESFEVTESLIISTDDDTITDVKDEVKKQSELGFKVEAFDKQRLRKHDLDGNYALLAKNDINLNPVAFTYRLMGDAIKNYGLTLYENTSFVRMSSDSQTNTIELSANGQSFNVQANYVVFATGYNPPAFLKDDMKNLEMYKTYVTVTDDMTEFKKDLDYLAWEVKDSYTYFKYTFENRLMIGGLDTKAAQLEEKDAYINRDALISKVEELINDESVTSDAKYSYAALFGESKDNLPYIGISPGNDKVFVICGVGGNGTVYSTMASKMAKMWINGQSLDDYHYLRLGR